MLCIHIAVLTRPLLGRNCASFYRSGLTLLVACRCLFSVDKTLFLRQVNKLDGNYTRMLRTILNKSWRQHPTKQQLYCHLPPIMKTIQVRRTRSAGRCWRSKDELIKDVLLWTPPHGRAKARRLARTYIQHLCADTGCSPENLPEVMDSRVFANGPGNLGSIPGRVIPKTQKIVLDTPLLNTQHYKARIKGKVEQSRVSSSTFSCTLVQQLSKREPSDHLRLLSHTLLCIKSW